MERWPGGSSGVDMRDYSEVEAKVENDMIRTELKPTPGGWWLEDANGVIVAKDGKCCLFSPQLLGRTTPIVSYLKEFADLLSVDRTWILWAIHGFDGSSPPLSSDDIEHQGWDFGHRMRLKHVEVAQGDKLDPWRVCKTCKRENMRKYQ